MITKKRITISALLTTYWFCHVGVAAEAIDHEVIAAIKEEGIQRSQVMETLSYLTDVHGPRFSGTPGYYAAAEWARGRMRDWGLDAHLETYPADYLSWSIEAHSVEMTSPRYMRLQAVPAPWASSTEEVSGKLVEVQFDDLEALKKHQGKLEGKILILPAIEGGDDEEPVKHYLSAEELRTMTRALKPIIVPPDDEPTERIFDYLQQWPNQEKESRDNSREITAWLKKQGVVALLESSWAPYGVIKASSAALAMEGPDNSFPAFVLSKEHHGRLLRILGKGISPTVKLSLSTRYHGEDKYQSNVIAEIKGSNRNKRDEVVLVGSHFDSWQTGTGATDNAANSAALMEALRILKSLDLKMDRTVRIGLWGAEEYGFEGSVGYARKHFGTVIQENDFKDAQAKISAYFNLDNGAGKIRGVHLQGNEKVRVFFTDNLAPFAYLDANHVTAMSAGGTDHIIFDDLNIPSFQFIQDPLDYLPRTHHSTLDLYEFVDEEAMKQNAVIMASLIYHAATRDELLPRKKLLPPIHISKNKSE